MTLPAKAMSRPFSLVAERCFLKVALFNRTFDGVTNRAVIAADLGIKACGHMLRHARG